MKRKGPKKLLTQRKRVRKNPFDTVILTATFEHAFTINSMSAKINPKICDDILELHDKTQFLISHF